MDSYTAIKNYTFKGNLIPYENVQDILSEK